MMDWAVTASQNQPQPRREGNPQPPAVALTEGGRVFRWLFETPPLPTPGAKRRPRDRPAPTLTAVLVWVLGLGAPKKRGR